MSEHPEPEGGIHLLLADQTVSEGIPGRRYLTLCNKVVPLVSAVCSPECDREHFLRKTRLILSDLVRSYPRVMTPMVGVTKLARAVGIAV